MSSEIIAQILKISNGFLVVDYKTGEQHYIKSFGIQELLNTVAPVDHEKKLYDIVDNTPRGNKIPAIKAVREYCIANNYDRYTGLREAKDYVEQVRDRHGLLLFPPRYV